MHKQSSINPILLVQERLQILKDLQLNQSDGDTLYDRLTQLASHVLGTPISLMSMVTSDRQVFKSEYGLTGWAKDDGETPLSHSFCKHVVETNKPLIVEDARQSAMLKDNLAIRDLNVVGYLGIPITVMDGQRLGSFCAIDTKPHQWTYMEIALMKELTQILVRDINLRAKARLDPSTYTTALEVLESKLNQLLDRLDTEQSLEAVLVQLRELRDEMDI